MKLMSSSLPKRRNPSRAGRGDVFISSSKTTHQEEIFRAEVQCLLMALLGGDAQRLGVS